MQRQSVPADTQSSGASEEMPASSRKDLVMPSGVSGPVYWLSGVSTVLIAAQ
jgi:hypothetical protein